MTIERFDGAELLATVNVPASKNFESVNPGDLVIKTNLISNQFLQHFVKKGLGFLGQPLPAEHDHPINCYLYRINFGYIVHEADKNRCYDCSDSSLDYLTYCPTPDDVRKACPELYQKAFKNG